MRTRQERDEGRSYDKASGRQLAKRIKPKGRTARARKSEVSYRLSALAEQDLEGIWLYVAEEAGPATDEPHA